MADEHVVELELLEAGPRGLSQLLVALDRVYLPRDASKDGGGVPRAGADLEHAVIRAQSQRFRHQCHDEGLGNRLPLRDRQRAVLVRELRQVGRQETLPRHRPHRSEHCGVANSA